VVQELPAGRSTIPFTFEAADSGSIEIAALAEADYDQPLADDRLGSQVPVSDYQPILVIDDPALADLIREAGAAVQEGGPGDIQAPLDWSAIVLRGAANRFTAGQHQLLLDYVDNGGGLLMSGGPDSFGFGGWF